MVGAFSFGVAYYIAYMAVEEREDSGEAFGRTLRCFRGRVVV